MWRAIGIVMTLILFTNQLIAADPSIHELIQQLGDPSYHVREQVTKELLNRGSSGLDALRGATLNHPDPEVRKRAQKLSEQIQRGIDATQITSTKTIALNYENVQLGVALADLKRKTGIPLTLDTPNVANPLRLITVKTNPLPYWQAIDDFCLAAGLRETFRPELAPPTAAAEPDLRIQKRIAYSMPGPVATELASQVPILLADGSPLILPGDRSTAVRILALPPNFPGNEVIRGAGQIVVNLDITPLPSILWDDVSCIRIHRAEDENGRPLTASYRNDRGSVNPPSANDLWLGNGMPAQVAFVGDFAFYPLGSAQRPNPRIVPVVLKTDDRSIRSLRVLDGVVTGEITLTNQTLVEIDNLPNTVGSTVTGPGQIKYQILDYKTLPNGKVTVKVRSEGPNPWTMRRLGRRGVGGNNIMVWDTSASSAVGPNQLRFTDSSGNPLTNLIPQSTSTSDDGFRQTMEVEFAFTPRTGQGAPVSLAIIGNKSVTIDVPFRLRDVLLP